MKFTVEFETEHGPLDPEDLLCKEIASTLALVQQRVGLDGIVEGTIDLHHPVTIRLALTPAEGQLLNGLQIAQARP